MSTRYGRTQFLKDAARLGLSRDAAFSRIELRRRRDRLMIVHHPDRGGDAKKAARINAIYARMLGWLDAQAPRSGQASEGKTPKADRGASVLSEALIKGATRIGGLALVAAAGYAALRRRPKA